MKLRVLPTHDASKVRASGPGLTTGLSASFPVEFTIDAKDAGEGQLSVHITVSLHNITDWLKYRHGEHLGLIVNPWGLRGFWGTAEVLQFSVCYKYIYLMYVFIIIITCIIFHNLGFILSLYIQNDWLKYTLKVLDLIYLM